MTRNSKDFAPLLRAWAEAGRDHAGCILVWSLPHAEHAAIVAGIERLLEEVPTQKDWRNLAVAL